MKCSKSYFYELSTSKDCKYYSCKRKNIANVSHRQLGINYACKYIIGKGRLTLFATCLSSTEQLKIISWLSKFGNKNGTRVA